MIVSKFGNLPSNLRVTSIMGTSSPMCVLAATQTGRLAICSDKFWAIFKSTTNLGAERLRFPDTMTFLAPNLANRSPCCLLVARTRSKL